MANKLVTATRFFFKTARDNFIRGLGDTTQFTAPEFYKTLKKPLDKADDSANFLVDILLFPLATVPGWLTGAFIAPFIYYSFYLNLPAFYNAPSGLLYSDISTFKKPKFFGGPLVLFGIPGVILGLVPGVIVAILHTMIRFISNCGISAYRTTVKGLNFAVSDMQPLQIKHLINEDKRSWVERAFGLPGKLLGFTLGSVAYISVIIIRGIASTMEHIVRIFYTAAERPVKGTSAEHIFKLPIDKRGRPEYGYGNTYALGILGIFPLGIASALVGLIVGAGIRLMIEITPGVKRAASYFLQPTPTKKEAPFKETTPPHGQHSMSKIMGKPKSNKSSISSDDNSSQNDSKRSSSTSPFFEHGTNNAHKKRENHDPSTELESVDNSTSGSFHK